MLTDVVEFKLLELFAITRAVTEDEDSTGTIVLAGITLLLPLAEHLF